MAVCLNMILSMSPSRTLRTSVSSRSAAAPAPLRTVPRRCAHRQPAPVHASAGAAAQVVSAGNPPAYGYVMASVAFTAAVLQWMTFKVAKARKAANVPYPQMTASGSSDAEKCFNWHSGHIFSCHPQRAHQNTLEILPIFLVSQLLIAQIYPLTAAALGFVWTIGRIIYAAGYSKGDPQKRVPGTAISFLPQFASIVILAWLAFSLIRA